MNLSGALYAILKVAILRCLQYTKSEKRRRTSDYVRQDYVDEPEEVKFYLEANG